MDVTPYLDNLRRNRERARQADAQAAAEARARLPALVRLLVDELGASRVVLFGSLAGGAFHARSDVDLAVAGLAPERYWEALWRCEKVAHRHVDLVPLEEATPTLRAYLADYGEVLHG